MPATEFRRRGKVGRGAEGNASLMESTAVHTDTQALCARTHSSIHAQRKDDMNWRVAGLWWCVSGWVGREAGGKQV